MRIARISRFSSFTRVAAISALAMQLATPLAAHAAKLESPLIFSAHDDTSLITQAFDINKTGVITGFYYDANYHATGFLRNPDGSYADIEYPAPATDTFPRAINDKGVVVGHVTIDGWMQGFSYATAKGKFTAIQMPGARATAVESINNHGVAAGFVYFYPDRTRPTYFTVSGFTYKNGTYTQVDVPGALYTYIRSINDNGDVAGNYTDAATFASHSFVLKADGTLTVVDAVNAVNHAATIYALNKKGDSVGVCTDSSFTSWGCYYTAATGAVNQFSAGTLGSAYPWAIKYSQVVGYGYDFNTGKNRAFVIRKADAAGKE